MAEPENRPSSPVCYADEPGIDPSYMWADKAPEPAPTRRLRQRVSLGIAAALALIALAVALSGCVTAANGSRQSVAFDSAPTGATVTVAPERDPDDEIVQSCVTPCALALARNADWRATFARPGCYPVEMRVAPVLGETERILALLPDYWTGSVYNLAPDPLKVTLLCGVSNAPGS